MRNLTLLSLGLSASLWAASTSITVELANQHQVRCEIANTPATLSRGLMFRTELDSQHGMLFVFPYPDYWPFWMKNTKIPLDMIWLNQEHQVIYIVENAMPCQQDCPFYRPKTLEKASYVLELNGGQVKAQNIHLGSQLKFLEITN